MNTTPSPAVDQKYEADIVIVGGGLSGLSAALTAAENGVRAIVLEKMQFLGGAGLFPEGSLGIGTRFQKEHGVEITTEKVFAKAMEFHHWRCNASVIRALLEESGKTIDWLENLGVEIKGIRTMFPPEKSLQVWHIFKGSGARVVKILSERTLLYLIKADLLFCCAEKFNQISASYKEQVPNHTVDLNVGSLKKPCALFSFDHRDSDCTFCDLFQAHVTGGQISQG